MKFYMKEMLTNQQLQRLSEHKYSSAGSTFLDPWMQKYWNWIVTKFPMTLAPNLMTLAGLIVNILSTLILVYYSPDAQQAAPWWSFLLFALGLFVYQTLDACDGKQARRTGSSSPLGELFDHGCDSLSTVFVCIAVCVSVQLGVYPLWMFYQCMGAVTLFYMAHWQTYVSGTLRFGKFDVTEAQLAIIIIHILSAIFGPKVWATKVPFLNVDLKMIPLYIAMGCTTYALYGYLIVIFTGGVGKNGSTVAGTSILSPCIPIATVVVPASVIYLKSPSNLYENHPCLYLMTFGLVAAKITNKLVVAHMTKSEMDYFDSVLIGPAMLFLNQYFNTFLNEYFVLWFAMFYTAADLFYYTTNVCRQIAGYLHISVFSITSKPHEKSVKSSVSTANDTAKALLLEHELDLTDDEDDIILDQLSVRVNMVPDDRTIH